MRTQISVILMLVAFAMPAQAQSVGKICGGGKSATGSLIVNPSAYIAQGNLCGNARLENIKGGSFDLLHDYQDDGKTYTWKYRGSIVCSQRTYAVRDTHLRWMNPPKISPEAQQAIYKFVCEQKK